MAGVRLIDLQTDLKSLRYGNDKPYVTKDINSPTNSNQTGMQINKRVDDVSRIAQMLVDRPGLKFIGNQALLQQADVQGKLQKARDKKSTLGGKIFEQVKNTTLNTAKIVGSTLAQVPVNGTGTHFVYGFRTDTYLQPSGENNRSAFAQFFGAGGVEGAQYALRGEPVPIGRLETTPEGKILKETTAKPGELGILNIGVRGDTEHLTPGFAESSQYSTTSSYSQAKVVVGQPNPVYTQNRIEGSIDHQTVSGSYKGPTGEIISGSYIEKQVKRFSKNLDVRRENRILLGDQGGRRDEAKSKNQYWTTTSGSLEQDKINMLFPVAEKVDGEKEGRDLIKFRFHIVTPDQTRILYFRAFLDSFSDNYTGQWNPTKYLGRAEDFQVYSGFQRKINLSFKIAAATRSEMKPLYQKMVYLASSTAPTYTDGGQFMRGTIVKMTVGDYIYELPGVLNNVTYNWNVDYPWEIAMKEPEGTGEDSTMQELPMIMDCSIDFTPIHTFTPETGLKKYITAGTNGTNSFI